MSIEASIANASMSLNAFKLQQAVEISVMKKTMELQELQIQALISNLPDVAPPSANVLDVKA